jgi:hypothetical protein
MTADDDRAIEELEQLGTALDALRLAHVALEILPELRGTYASWQVARAIVNDEASVQDPVREAARLRESQRAGAVEPLLASVRRAVEARALAPERARSLRSLVEAHFQEAPPWPSGATPDHVFAAIAAYDARAAEVQKDPSRVADVRRKIDKLLAIDSKP